MSFQFSQLGAVTAYPNVRTRSSLTRSNFACPSLARPSLARPSLARPSLAHPSLARPSLARSNLAAALTAAAAKIAKRVAYADAVFNNLTLNVPGMNSFEFWEPVSPLNQQTFIVGMMYNVTKDDGNAPATAANANIAVTSAVTTEADASSCSFEMPQNLEKDVDSRGSGCSFESPKSEGAHSLECSFELLAPPLLTPPKLQSAASVPKYRDRWNIGQLPPTETDFVYVFEANQTRRKMDNISE